MSGKVGQFARCITYITMLLVAFLLVAVMVILVAVYFTSAGLVYAYIQEHPQHKYTSLPVGLKATLNHMNSFFHGGIKHGRQLTNTSVESFNNQLKVSHSFFL